jgi:hypothetical protein
MKRYVVEGTWSGYIPAQRKVVHRVILPLLFVVFLRGIDR